MTAEFLFGSPQQTNPFLIPIILLLSFLCAAYGFSVLSRHYFALGDFFVLKSELRTVFSLATSFIVFIIILFSNKAFGLIAFFGLLIVVCVLIYLFDLHYSKLSEEHKIGRIKREQTELKETNSKQKKKKLKKC